MHGLSQPSEAANRLEDRHVLAFYWPRELGRKPYGSSRFFSIKIVIGRKTSGMA